MDSLRHHHCTRKKPYKTRKAALTSASLAAKRTGSIFSTYKCWYGSHYHIGHANVHTRMQVVKLRIEKLKRVRNKKLRAGDTISQNP